MVWFITMFTFTRQLFAKNLGLSIPRSNCLKPRNKDFWYRIIVCWWPVWQFCLHLPKCPYLIPLLRVVSLDSEGQLDHVDDIPMIHFSDNQNKTTHVNLLSAHPFLTTWTEKNRLFLKRFPYLKFQRNSAWDKGTIALILCR